MFFILAGIIVLVGLFLTIGAVVSSPHSPPGRGVRVILTLGLTAALFMGNWLMFSYNRIDHREVAVVTSLGAYQKTIDEGGVHWLKPWAKTEGFTLTKQTPHMADISVSFTDGSDDPATQEIGGGKGMIDITVPWSVSKNQEQGGAKALWESYRTFDEVSSVLVDREARAATIDIANDYPAGTAIIRQDEIADKVEKRLNERLEKYGILVEGVSVTAIDLDEGTQQAVNRIFTTKQDVERAKEEQRRAEIDAETVRIREAEGALSPAANQRFCLDVVNNWDVAKNGSLPATFDCALGGASNEVIVNTP